MLDPMDHGAVEREKVKGAETVVFADVVDESLPLYRQNGSGVSSGECFRSSIQRNLTYLGQVHVLKSLSADQTLVIQDMATGVAQCRIEAVEEGNDRTVTRNLLGVVGSSDDGQNVKVLVEDLISWAHCRVVGRCFANWSGSDTLLLLSAVKALPSHHGLLGVSTNAADVELGKTGKENRGHETFQMKCHEKTHGLVRRKGGLTYCFSQWSPEQAIMSP